MLSDINQSFEGLEPGGPLPSLGDLGLFRMSFRYNWGMAPELRLRILQRMVNLNDPATPDVPTRLVIAASKVLLAAQRQQVAAGRSK